MIADPARTFGRRPAAALGAFAVVSVIHLAAQLVGVDGVANVSQWFLMPLLAGFLALATAAPRIRLVRLTLAALGLSWLGDAAPDLAYGDTAFLVMIGSSCSRSWRTSPRSGPTARRACCADRRCSGTSR